MRAFLDSIRTMVDKHKTRREIQGKFPGTVIEDVVVGGDLRNLRLGRNVVIQPGSVLHLGGLQWCQNQGWLEIGDGSVVSPNCVIYGCGPGGVRIGKRFDCGPGVGIFSSRTEFRSRSKGVVFSPVTIGDDVTVFANAIISPGVTIGDNAVIAACSVVTRDVPASSFVGGSPARVIEENVRG